MKPSIGRIVHYRLATDVVRPAIVVRVLEDDIVNLQVFSDGDNDAHVAHDANAHEGTLWRTSVHYSDAPEAGTWAWPPKV